MFLSFQYVTFIPLSSFSFTKQTIFTRYLLLTIITSTTALVYVPKLPIATLSNAVFQRIKKYFTLFSYKRDFQIVYNLLHILP